MKSEKEKFHERLEVTLEQGDDARLTQVLSNARAADIAESLDLLRDEERSRIIFALPPHTAAEVVILLDEAVRGDVVDDLDTESLTEILSELQPDDAADVLGELDEEEADEILEHMKDEQSEKIEELLEYDEETAGGIMTPDVVAVPADATVADAVEMIRDASQDEDLHEVFIVDSDRTLIGIVPLRHLVTNPPTTRLSDLSDRDPVTVLANDDQETVVQVIRKYDVSEVAVVDERNRLLGRVTHDDLIDVVEEEAAEDLFRMAGTDPSELETSSVFHAMLIRLMWLLPCMCGMLLTASVLLISETKFNPVLFATLAAFAPMIGAMGGNSGIQISTIIVRGFATGELVSLKLTRALLREGRIAIIMAPICGVSAFTLAMVSQPLLQWLGIDIHFLPDQLRLATAVGIGMTFAILMAAILGILLPFSFRRLGVDPAIASGPLVTTLNDFFSVSIYMITATFVAR